MHESTQKKSFFLTSHLECQFQGLCLLKIAHFLTKETIQFPLSLRTALNRFCIILSHKILHFKGSLVLRDFGDQPASKKRKTLKFHKYFMISSRVVGSVGCKSCHKERFSLQNQRKHHELHHVVVFYDFPIYNLTLSWRIISNMLTNAKLLYIFSNCNNAALHQPKPYLYCIQC